MEALADHRPLSPDWGRALALVDGHGRQGRAGHRWGFRQVQPSNVAFRRRRTPPLTSKSPTVPQWNTVRLSMQGGSSACRRAYRWNQRALVFLLEINAQGILETTQRYDKLSRISPQFGFKWQALSQDLQGVNMALESHFRTGRDPQYFPTFESTRDFLVGPKAAAKPGPVCAQAPRVQYRCRAEFQQPGTDAVGLLRNGCRQRRSALITEVHVVPCAPMATGCDGDNRKSRANSANAAGRERKQEEKDGQCAYKDPRSDICRGGYCRTRCFSGRISTQRL